MESSNLYSELGSTILASLAGLLIVVVLAIIFKRFSGKTSDRLGKPGGLDLIDLKKRGLLSPEELSRVGEAMARQIQREENREKRKTSIGSAEHLLLDPEVRRLETMANAAKTADDKARAGQAAPSAHPFHGETPGKPSGVSNVVENINDVELPMDIQQLADSGLLTEEEIANVKRRILEKRAQ